jgi:hypothetical protein
VAQDQGVKLQGIYPFEQLVFNIYFIVVTQDNALLTCNYAANLSFSLFAKGAGEALQQ